MSKNSLLALIISAVATFGLLAGTSAHADTVTLLTSAPYAEDNEIADKILDGCTTLGSKLTSYTKTYAKKKGVDVQLADDADINGPGRVLQLEITDAVSGGNAFIGHQKFVRVKGTLWEDGQEVASFGAKRSSGGGVLAGYKSSCSVLARCTKALGKDVAGWLKDPRDGAKLGD